MMRLGFHLSIAGAISNSAKEAAAKGYGAFQIFTTSSRSWKNSTIESFDSKEFKMATSSNDTVPYAHIPYLCNPASTNPDVYEKSRHMMVDNLNNCNALGIEGLVVHLGSHLGKGITIGIENVCNTLGFAIDSTEKAMILLENSAGYTNCVGSKFSEIGEIIDRVGSERIGVCFDTCHAFAAGYDIKDDESVDKIVGEFDSAIKLSRLKLVHLNDAKNPLGSRLDRHWHIGKGYIGEDGFTSLFRNNAFKSGSFVMELPEDLECDHNADMLAARSIIKIASEN
jgi:deoxyribonuclease IV